MGKEVLDKNPDQVLADALEQISENVLGRGPHMMVASKPFHKAELVNALLDFIDYPAIILDFDLLYSGYVAADMIPKRDNVYLFNPRKEDWNKILHGVLEKMCQERFMVIIDSLNGFHNMYSDKDSARFVNASLMLLAFMGKFSRCPVVVMALARKNKKNEHVLSPGGRRLINFKESVFYTADKNNDMLSIMPQKMV